MARSILPSRWRSAGREKARVKRAVRRQVSTVMASLSNDPDAWDDVDGVYESADREVRGIVDRRRSSDKVNPFIRWATETTKHLPKDSRVRHLRGVLPKGLIGDHALVHLTRLEPFDLRPRKVWKRKSLLLDRGHLATVLRRVLEVKGGHALVNDVLARHAIVDQSDRPLSRSGMRLLGGVHDVVPLLDALESWPQRPVRYVLDALCRALWQAHFELDRALELMPSPVVVPSYDWHFV